MLLQHIGYILKYRIITVEQSFPSGVHTNPHGTAETFRKSSRKNAILGIHNELSLSYINIRGFQIRKVRTPEIYKRKKVGNPCCTVINSRPWSCWFINKIADTIRCEGAKKFPSNFLSSNSEIPEVTNLKGKKYMCRDP